jgi:hypothetical protein
MVASLLSTSVLIVLYGVTKEATLEAKDGSQVANEVSTN